MKLSTTMESGSAVPQSARLGNRREALTRRADVRHARWIFFQILRSAPNGRPFSATTDCRDMSLSRWVVARRQDTAGEAVHDHGAGLG